MSLSRELPVWHRLEQLHAREKAASIFLIFSLISEYEIVLPLVWEEFLSSGVRIQAKVLFENHIDG